MARNQRKYDTEYKVQAVKLSKEIGSAKAASELGISVDTLYGCVKAAMEGRLDTGSGSHMPESAMGPYRRPYPDQTVIPSSGRVIDIILYIKSNLRP